MGRQYVSELSDLIFSLYHYKQKMPWFLILQLIILQKRSSNGVAGRNL